MLKKRGFLKSIAQALHPMTSFSFIYANKSQLVDRFASWIEIFAFIIDKVFDGFLEEDPSRIRAFFELSKTINQEEDIDYVISIFSAANVFKFIRSQPEIYDEGIELLTFLKTKFPHRLLLALSWLGDRSSILISDMKMKENTFSNSSNDDNSKSSTSTLSIHDEEIRTRVAFTVHATKLKNFLQISKVDFNVEVISDIKRRLLEFSADKVNLLPVELRESLANLFENKFLAYYEIAYAQAKPLQFLYFPGTFIKVLKYLDCFKSADLREKARRIFDESYANIISKLENRKTHVFLFDISNYFEEFYHHLLDEREFVIKASRIIEIFPANAVIFEIVIGFLKKRGCENNVLSVLNIQREVT
ncbi:MAG: hypothetical protein EBU93_07720, partial [Chlamydiae bacterium]|nr:hypothetical protein [Chlamydiota bacterium]